MTDITPKKHIEDWIKNPDGIGALQNFKYRGHKIQIHCQYCRPYYLQIDGKEIAAPDDDEIDRDIPAEIDDYLDELEEKILAPKKRITDWLESLHQLYGVKYFDYGCHKIKISYNYIVSPCENEVCVLLHLYIDGKEIDAPDDLNEGFDRDIPAEIDNFLDNMEKTK